jgi:hypothetical protein
VRLFNETREALKDPQTATAISLRHQQFTTATDLRNDRQRDAPVRPVLRALQLEDA